MTRRFLLVCSVLALSTAASQAQAALLVNWQVDTSASYVRLGLPANTSITLDGTAVTVRLRTASNGNLNDNLNQGTRAAVQGSFETALHSNGYVTYTGVDTLRSVDAGSFRPNPAAFDPNNTNADNPDGQYSGNANGNHAYGARAIVAALGGLITAHAAFLAIGDVDFDLAGYVPYNTSSQAAGLGIASSKAYLDGANISLIGSQPLPDMFEEDLVSFAPLYNTNNQALTIDVGLFSYGGNDYTHRLSQNINIVYGLELDEGIVLNITGTALIRGYANAPEPASFSLLGLAVSGLALRRRRQA